MENLLTIFIREKMKITLSLAKNQLIPFCMFGHFYRAFLHHLMANILLFLSKFRLQQVQRTSMWMTQQIDHFSSLCFHKRMAVLFHRQPAILSKTRPLPYCTCTIVRWRKPSGNCPCAMWQRPCLRKKYFCCFAKFQTNGPPPIHL